MLALGEGFRALSDVSDKRDQGRAATEGREQDPQKAETGEQNDTGKSDTQRAAVENVGESLSDQHGLPRAKEHYIGAIDGQGIKIGEGGEAKQHAGSGAEAPTPNDLGEGECRAAEHGAETLGGRGPCGHGL